MDFDRIETVNRDRLICASEHDAQRQRKEVDLAQELCLRAATAAAPVIEAYDMGPLRRRPGMRNATWRSHVLRPGRPCMICNSSSTPA